MIKFPFLLSQHWKSILCLGHTLNNVCRTHLDTSTYKRKQTAVQPQMIDIGVCQRNKHRAMELFS